MTFSQQIKEEIFAGKPLSGKERGFFCYGMIMCAGQFSEESAEIETESEAVSKLYCFAISDIIGRKVRPRLSKSVRGEDSYIVSIEGEEAERLFSYFDGYLTMLTEDSKNLAAFISGAFMASGTANDPAKEYRLEFHPSNEEVSDVLFMLLTELGYPPKSTERAGRSALYIKESEQIEDLLAIIGATNCSLELMETKILKEVRNNTNRQSNCDTANIDKTINAAQQQISDINYIYSKGKESLLIGGLLEIADLRRENPDMSLRELSEELDISRSGVNYRFKKISELAAKIRLEAIDE